MLWGLIAFCCLQGIQLVGYKALQCWLVTFETL